MTARKDSPPWRSPSRRRRPSPPLIRERIAATGSCSGRRTAARNPPLRHTDITVTDEAMVRRAVTATSLGSAMEWFDFGVYSYLAVTIGHC